MKTITNHIDPQELDNCQEQINYSFKDITLLTKALTHTSRRSDFNFSNERLEFLGDAVLGMIISEYLFKMFPDYYEGELTKIKSVVVSQPTLAKVGHSLNLETYLIVGKGLVNRLSFPRSLLANAFEAVVGAIYLDGGLEIVQKFIMDKLCKEIDIVCNNEHKKNYKSLLQQCCQKEFGSTPIYKVLQQHGPDHVKVFQIAVVMDNTEYGIGWGKSKKEAAQIAAFHTLKAIKPDTDY